MKRTSALRYAAIGMATLGLGMGAALASSVDFDTTGADSTATVTLNNINTASVTNDNSADVTNDNTQDATTGDARVIDSTNGGDASTGDAMNDADTDTDVDFGGGNWSLPSGFWAAGDDDVSASTTGADSDLDVTINNLSTFTLSNTNSATVDNTNDQTATSGDARVIDSTGGGSATSGNASNSVRTSTSVSF